MKIEKNKIGCLDSESSNYDPTCGIACERCCINDEMDKDITKLINLKRYGYQDVENIDYSLYAVKHIDNQPLFSLKTQAEDYGLQIDCLGYHVHKIDEISYYMACSSHEEATEEAGTKPTVEDFIEEVNNQGVIEWKKMINYKRQRQYCEEKQKDGYFWNLREKKCMIEPQKNESLIGNYQILGYVENVPVFYTSGAALSYGHLIKCEGYNTYNMNGTLGYLPCKEQRIATTNRGDVYCLDVQEKINEQIIFTALSPTNIKTYGEMCCMEWNHKGYNWNGSGCIKNEKPLTWSCVEELTTQIYNGTGEYKTFEECYNSCEVNKIK